MKWCCEALNIAYEHAGQRGIAMLFDRDCEGTPEFLLQARAFDAEPPIPPFNSPTTMNLVSERRVRFCPWCGTHLEPWYGRYIDNLVRPGLKTARD